MEPIGERRWRISEPEPQQVQRLARELKVPQVIASLLVNRGVVEPAEAARFLTPALGGIHDPFLLQGMDRAVERLAAAFRKNERVCVYGDYDVDGISAVALLIDFFRGAGLDCFYHIPKRLEEGYGLSAEGIEAAAHRGANVIVTVDCGITADKESRLCSSLGIDLIITDHHTPGEVIPQACAVINPHLPGCPFPFKALAGVGVAFNLLVALRNRLREEGVFGATGGPNLREYLDLVALGTVADIVPLLDENRIFVKFGLAELTRSPRLGIQALKRVAGVADPVGCGAVGFRLAPRLNAAGRLEDAALGVELLLCSDPAEAHEIATRLDSGNAERQALEQEMLHDVLQRVKGEARLAGRKSIVLASKDWHPGVIGIVASRIVDIFHRPTILIALQEGNGRGSGRSIPAFHLHDALHACSEHLQKFGGHKYAAGLSIDEAILEAFVARFDEVAHGVLTEADLTPEIKVDAELSGEEITVELAEMVGSLSPFGMGNPEPVFMVKGATVTARRVLKEQHLKLRLAVGGKSLEAIGFNMAQGKDLAGTIDVLFSLEVNAWNGKRGLQLRLKDFRESSTAAFSERESAGMRE
ncbi:MAG TPA: single-stranded-DNA-specific exonuclease RecJ [Geobacteraceae bacterium]|nr:single-stranded-DNA-specific exonuclease RecJ [Geobacteraceae bacterium]